MKLVVSKEALAISIGFADFLRRKSAELRKEPLPLCRLLFSRSKPFLAAADHPKFQA